MDISFFFGINGCSVCLCASYMCPCAAQPNTKSPLEGLFSNQIYLIWCLCSQKKRMKFYKHQFHSYISYFKYM